MNRTLKNSYLRPSGAKRLLLYFVLCAFGAATHATAQEAHQTADYWRELAAQRITAEKTRAEAQSDWQLKKALLEQQISLLESEAKTLDEQIAQANTALASAGKEREKFESELNAIRSEAESGKTTLRDLEAQLAERYKTLPIPLQKKVFAYINGFDATAAEKKSFGERVQNLVSVLNEIEKARKLQNIQREALKLSDSEPERQMKVVYLGLDMAYATDENETIFYMGYPGKDGWKWTQLESKETVIRFFKMLENREKSDWLELPVQTEVSR